MALNLKRREQIFGLALAMPAVIYIVAIMIYPAIDLIRLSFSSLEGYGLSNYETIFADADFGMATACTIIVALATVGLELGFGFISALVLSKDFKGRGFMRSLFILPWAIPTVASAFLWRYVFTSAGWLNSLLNYLGMEAMTYWILDYPYLPIFVAETWKMTPFIMLMLLAGLQSIPKELLESAHVDGATTSQTFRKITLPLMIPVVISAVVIRLIDALRIFTVPWIIMGEGGGFDVLGTYIVRQYRAYRIGPSAAAAVILVIIVSVAVFSLTLLNRRVARR
jgi:ABC-type sugar transport system permease subunit